jgi:hypothetical protein
MSGPNVYSSDINMKNNIRNSTVRTVGTNKIQDSPTISISKNLHNPLNSEGLQEVPIGLCYVVIDHTATQSLRTRNLLFDVKGNTLEKPNRGD